PEQKQNISREQPMVVAELYELFTDHYRDVLADGLPPVPFRVGGEENPVRLTVRDWHPEHELANGYGVIWQQAQLSDDTLEINGYWDIEVAQAGLYEIRISRYPNDAPGPLGATSVRLSIGDLLSDCQVDRAAHFVTFEMNVSAGRTRLQAWCSDDTSGRTRGAYFVEIKRLK
ncbi:MAG: hypothetical protein KDB03_08995, partial [Planctomycetales bacterium]|nr:hypothetical protein [Planctomycetales bacterium]